MVFTVSCTVCIGKFNPYSDNGGTVVCIAGKDYCVIAADTRLSDQYMIRSRKVSRIFSIEDGVVLTGSGCWSDLVALSKDLQAYAQTFRDS